jgi:fatty-acid desaturase
VRRLPGLLRQTRGFGRTLFTAERKRLRSILWRPNLKCSNTTSMTQPRHDVACSKSGRCIILEFIALFFLFYLWHGLGITVGLHRLLAHRSFRCPKPIEYFFVMGGYLAFQGSPIWWTAMHRAHHRYADTQLDAHSPHRGLVQAYVGWMTPKEYPSHINPAIQTKDLINDPLYKFLEQGGKWHRAHLLSFASCVLFRILLLCCFGWIVALASVAAGCAVWFIPLLLNVACHMPHLGYKTFKASDDSVNVWWVAILAVGEGWHNNHHAFPGSAKTGMLWHELDISWLTILALKNLGLAHKVHEPPPHRVSNIIHS